MLMWRIILNFAPFISGITSFFNLTFQQHDWELKFDWAETVRYNKQYVTVFEVRAFKFNRSCTAANMTLEYAVEVGRKMELVFQAYKFASNEYRLFPLRFQVNFCEGLELNLVGGKRALECGSFHGCPLRKGIQYRICNFVPDSKEFPPYIPSGKYKIEIQGCLGDIELWVGNVYGEVFRPFVG